jgi:hypothetical protein
MNDNRVLILGVAALAAFFVVQRAKAQAAKPAAGSTGIKPLPKMPAKGTVTNLSGNYWGALIGDSLGALVNPNTGKSLFGVNGFGQWVTSDGKPLTGDMANEIGTSIGIIPKDNIGGEQYLDYLFPELY